MAVTSTSAPAEQRWDFFVAHASADASTAAKLSGLLEEGGATAFFDAKDLLPGDIWPRVLAQAQESSAVTVILVSKNTASSYYQLDELASAIDISRRINPNHRVAPVFLEDVDRVPFGLRVVHGLLAVDDGGLERAASQLLRLLRRGQAVAKLWSPLVPAVGRYFAGRDEVLGRLSAHHTHRSAVQTQAIAGLGGVGKTTLAAALCWEQADVVDIVWWLRAETESSLVPDLADLAIELRSTGAGREDLVTLARRAMWALEREERSWLLVFDNAMSDDLVHRFTPKRGNGRVIVTTRRQDFGRLGPVIDVDVFDARTAEAFLRARVLDTNPEAANESSAADVARRLGGLPLALEQAGAFVAYSPLRSFAGYLKRLDDAGLDPFVDGKPLDYEATASTTWQVSIDAATLRAPAAAKVMCVFAYLAAAPVPIGCFVDDAGAAHPYLATIAPAVIAAIEELYAYSLVTIETDKLSVQRVVQDAARRNCDPVAASFAVDALRRMHPENVEQPASWALCSDLLPHVLKVAATAITDNPGTVAKVRWLLDQAGTALRYAGAAERAIPLLERATKMEVDAINGNPATVTSRNNLAAAYWSAGRVTEAIAVHEAAAAAMEELLGANSPEALMCRNNLALAYRAAGRIAEAVTLHEATLADRERLLGPNHPDTLTSRNNLGADYREGGRIADALTLHQTTLADRERLLGLDHPDTLASRDELAETYHVAGLIADAVVLHRAILADRIRLLGPDHPDTLISRNNLAASHRFAGNARHAVRLHQCTLAAMERVLGVDHPDTLTSRNNLAVAFYGAGQTKEAVALLQETLNAMERVLGVDHPDTLTSRNTTEDICVYEGFVETIERMLGLTEPGTQLWRRGLVPGRNLPNEVSIDSGDDDFL